MTDKIPDHDLADLLSQARQVLGCWSGEEPFWRNRKTKTMYVVYDVVLDESTKQVLVSYARNGVRWSRPMDDFVEKFDLVPPNQNVARLN